MFEFGAKVSVSLVEGYAREERLSWDNYHEGIDLKTQIDAYRDRYGAYPDAVCADKIYRTRDNLDFCKEKGIRLSGPKQGRPYKDEERRRESLGGSSARTKGRGWRSRASSARRNEATPSTGSACGSRRRVKARS